MGDEMNRRGMKGIGIKSRSEMVIFFFMSSRRGG